MTTADGQTLPDTSGVRFVDWNDAVVDVAKVGAFGSRTDNDVAATFTLLPTRKAGRADAVFFESGVDAHVDGVGAK